jgi:HK97 family phage major capsid protein
MDPKQLEAFTKAVETTVDGIIESKLKTIVGETAAFEARKVVETLRLERAMNNGNDRTGLTEDAKKDFVSQVKAISRGDKENSMRVKANEALIEEQDNRGGYLVPKMVADAIVRIAASVGFVMSHTQKWDLKTDELQIPAYTGSFLTGEYLGVDTGGSVTALTFDQAKLIVKKWQLAFVVSNDLVADSPVQLADWLLALGGEALANMIDKQGVAGTSAPFIGILNDANVNVYTPANGVSKTTFASFDMDDASDVIATLEESLLDGACFVFERTVWAKIRIKKDTAGNYVVANAGAPSIALMQNYSGFIGGAKPVGEIMGYPVFTVRHLPANSATAVSTKYGIFGNFSALAYGDKGDLRVAQFSSGSFGGKEIALADQTALVYKHRHGLVNTLPKSFVVIKTAAS